MIFNQDNSDLVAAINELKEAQQYHKGDTYVMMNGSTFVGTVNTAGTGFGAYISLPKEIGSDVTSFTFSGSPNFWGDVGGRITGITVASVSKMGPNMLGISGNLPSGTTRTSNTMGILNFTSGTITFN